MRVARILTRLNLGGPARQAMASDPLLSARGHAVRIFTGTPDTGEGDLTDAFREKGLDIVRVPGLSRSVSLFHDARALFALRAELARFAPDVVHTHASKAGFVGRRAARAVPHAARVHTFHGHVLEGYFAPAVSKVIAALERDLARKTDRVIAVSHATADDLLRHRVVEDERRLVVVPPGLDLEPLLSIDGRDGRLRAEIGAEDDAIVVGVVGRLAPVKRAVWAVDVFAMLAARHPRMHLAFVGDGPERAAVEARRASLSPDASRRVHVLGARVGMPPILADLDVVLATSRSEGAPVALIEAAAAARPVVATPVGGVPEIVAHERTGFLGETVDDLAYALSTLASDAAMRAAMGQRARMRVERRHGAEALCEKLEEIYSIVVEERACAS